MAENKAGATNEIQSIGRLRIHDGKLEEYKRLAAEALESVRTRDSGTLQYDLFFNEDQSEVIFLERYRDSEALLEHVANLGDLMEKILATASGSGEILGTPSPELKKALEGYPVRIVYPYQSL